MPWPAWYRRFWPVGTCYLSPRQFQEALKKHNGSGQAWRHNKIWTTYRPNGRVMYKAIRPAFMPRGLEDFFNIMRSCSDAGMQPPTSFADPFLHCFRCPFPRRSALFPFRGRSFGGWQEAFWRGSFFGKVYHYDLNKAYRWAACLGLPDLRTARFTDSWDDPQAVYLAKLWSGSKPYDKSYGVHVVTSEERDRLNITPERILHGVSFRETVDLSPAFTRIDKEFPYCRNRISRAFWGLWNARNGPERVTWKSGLKVGGLRNPFYNPVWAAIITARVKLRLSELLPVALHCFVDSVLSKEPLATGDAPGDFKLVGEYRGVFIRAPGIWGTGDRYIKHCGISALQEESPKVEYAQSP